MFRDKKLRLGVDIGTATIKLALIKPGIPAVEGLCQTPVPEGAAMGGRLLRPEELGMAIRSQLGIWNRDFSTSIAVSGPAVALRFLKLPLLKKAELETAIGFEVGSSLPFSLEDAFWDYEARRQDEHLEVLVAAAEKKVVAEYLAVLSAAGITPQAVELNAMALARSLRNQLVGTVAVLDLGLSFQELTIYSDANPVFYRLLPAPQEPAFAVGLPELVHELSRSFAFIGWERGQKVERLLLVGYGATRADLPPVLEEQLGIGVAPGEPFRRLRVPSGMETSPEYATAVGLALRGVRP